ncbi:acyltransferase [Alphaproteobacteria bacterium]|nr:acyltransferase [Alphaproteobacteria bacterium]
MGTLRLLLAVLVLASHSGIARFTGVLGVECFYVISGFYIQMILTEKYAVGADWKWRFYKSRFLRIFVPYWVILIIVAGLSIEKVKAFSGASALDLAISSFSNFFIIGSEQIKFFRIHEGCSYPLWDMLLIPQVWSVGLELVFYALIPFIFTYTRLMMGFVSVVIVAKVLMFSIADANFILNTECADGLLNGILPLEFGTFCAGALLYHIYLKLHIPPKFHPYFYVAVLSVIFATSFLLLGKFNDFFVDPEFFLINYHSYLLLIASVTPVLFLVSRSYAWDQFIGNLSYPFYLWHLFILQQLSLLNFTQGEVFGVALIITLVASALTLVIVETPVNRYRHRKFSTSPIPGKNSA